MGTRIILNWVGFVAIVATLSLGLVSMPTSFGQESASQPTTNPDLTNRQQNLLLQLSDAEANIQAINTALIRTGYKVGLAYDSINSNLKGNELMDRNGGGPVRWDAFYGRTAKDFDRLNTARYGSESDLRPRQFDFVYKANYDQIARAKDQIASLAQNQAALLARRQKHEADQCRLWATLVWEQVKDREIGLRPLSRFALKPQGPVAAVLQPVILFLRTADCVALEGLDSVQDDQEATFNAGSKRLELAYAAVQRSLADALESADLPPERRKEGESMKALCKALAEECKVIEENYANALDRDKAKEDNSKLIFRRQLQSSLTRFAAVVGQLDDEVARTAKAWGVEADKTKPTPDRVLPAPVVVGKTVPTGTPTNADSTAAGGGDAALATSNQLAELRFEEETGFKIAVLRQGVSTHHNSNRPITRLPDFLVGKQFCQVTSGIQRPVKCEFLTSGKVYFFVYQGEDTSIDSWRAVKTAGAVKEDISDIFNGQENFQAWSITGRAGKRFDLPVQVMLVANRLEKK